MILKRSVRIVKKIQIDRVWKFVSLERQGTRYVWDDRLAATSSTGTKGTGGAADEWVTQMLRQTDAKVFKKYFPNKVADETRRLGAAQSQSERTRARPAF